MGLSVISANDNTEINCFDYYKDDISLSKIYLMICMHLGSYDDEPFTVNLMHEYMKENGYQLDITDERFHHEIYLSVPRKCDVSKLKTVIRHPIKKTK